MCSMPLGPAEAEGPRFPGGIERQPAADTFTGQACRICGGHENRHFVAKEMMFGSRECFGYLECGSCGCVQIAAYPTDIARHYPADYYAFSAQSGPLVEQSVKGRIRAILMDIPLFRRWWLQRGSTQDWLRRRPDASVYLDLFPNAGVRLLDVGCGNGGLPLALRAMGYRHASGVDPYIAEDVMHEGRLLVEKAQLADISGQFDCISFHHALEHIPNQVQILTDAAARLSPDSVILIRIPVVGGLAWRTYGVDWVQLDAPRHFYLHSMASLQRLAEACALSIASVDFDSTGFQFWGSELYTRDIPLISADLGRQFSSDQLSDFDRQANELNEARDGDQIVAILKPRDRAP